MAEEKNHQQVVSGLEHKEEKIPRDGNHKVTLSANETPVPLLDLELKPWIKIIRPSRASLTYERME